MPLMKMERYKLQKRIQIIIIHYKNGENLAETVRRTRTFLGRREAPCRIAIKKLLEKFELLGQVSDVKNGTHARRSRTAENIAAVAESFEENPGLSIPRRSLELGIPQTLLHYWTTFTFNKKALRKAGFKRSAPTRTPASLSLPRIV